jgi:hypothetical protein
MISIGVYVLSKLTTALGKSHGAYVDKIVEFV